MAMREIVSKQFKHNGGFAHVEVDGISALPVVVCSGCEYKEPKPAMAPALADLVKHVGENAEPVSG